jgi:hypothetical protein
MDALAPEFDEKHDAQAVQRDRLDREGRRRRRSVLRQFPPPMQLTLARLGGLGGGEEGVALGDRFAISLSFCPVFWELAFRSS